jgi:hypothetical protein
MATHGYIRVEKENNETSIIHAFHDGYVDNMLKDLLELPTFIYKFLNTSEKNSYVLEMFRRDKEDRVKRGFDSIRALWSSTIPLKSIDETFESWLIASDPMMYIHSDEDVKEGDINIKFSDGRLPSCVISAQYANEEECDFDDIVEKVNKSIYLEENKIKKLPVKELKNGVMFSYHMNINLIVLDLIWQEIDPSINRDKKLQEILN